MALGVGGFKTDYESVLDDRAGILHVQGDIDAHSTRILQTAVGALFSQKRYALILDLSHVNYMSSSGASLFIVIQAEAKDNAGNLILMDVKPGVKQVLDLLGLTPLFQVAADRASALKQVTQNA